MALVKTSVLTGKGKDAAGPVKSTPPSFKPKARPRKRIAISQQSASERLAAATEQLAAGITQSAMAAEELQRTMELIAGSAERAAGAAQQSLGSISSLAADFQRARERSDKSYALTLALQSQLREAAEYIDVSIQAIETNAARQLKSVTVIGALRRQASTIGSITGAVADLSDQTGLLALNAAIQAARAGDDGRGFAVVADEVRSLAEVSEDRSREVRALAERISAEISGIVERIETAANTSAEEGRAGRQASVNLRTIRDDLAGLADGGKAILTAAGEADAAGREAQAGAETVASAAEEQAAESLAELAAGLQSNSAAPNLAAQVGAAAEELSATTQELAGAAVQILAAVEQIGRGAQLQASATQQASAAMTQIGRAAALADATAADSLAKVEACQTLLGESRARIGDLTRGQSLATEETRAVLELIETLDTSARAMEKLVDNMALVAVQTTMLAVSGSVEAARSGEHGRGFAQVSIDIRGLAKEAGDSADQAKDLIRAMQAQIALVRRDLEQIGAVADGEVQKSRSIDERLVSIAAAAEEVRAASQDIAGAAAGVRLAIEQVQEGVAQIAALPGEWNFWREPPRKGHHRDQGDDRSKHGQRSKPQDARDPEFRQG
jgi:methyl-accepting chemotaxis protein